MNNLENQAVRALLSSGAQEVANNYKDSILNGARYLDATLNMSGREVANKVTDSATTCVKDLGCFAKKSMITTVKDTGKFILGINNLETPIKLLLKKRYGKFRKLSLQILRWKVLLKLSRIVPRIRIV